MSLRALSTQTKIQELSKPEQMTPKFPWKAKYELFRRNFRRLCEDNKLEGHFVIPREVILLFLFLFATGSFRKCKPEFLVEYKAPKSQGGALNLFTFNC